MTDQTLRYIELSPKGGGQFVTVLGDNLVTLVTRYNYEAQCWCLDILDAQGTLMVAGLMLIPNIDILAPYPYVASLLGALVLVEQTVGQHLLATSLGLTTKLLWFPVGTEVVLPT